MANVRGSFKCSSVMTEIHMRKTKEKETKEEEGCRFRIYSPSCSEKRGGLTQLHKCAIMVPLEYKEALYISTSKLLND